MDVSTSDDQGAMSASSTSDFVRPRSVTPLPAVTRRRSCVSLKSNSLVPDELLNPKSGPIASVNLATASDTDNSPRLSVYDSLDSLADVLPPIINDTQSVYNVAAPSIFSEEASMLATTADEMEQRPIGNYGFDLEYADDATDPTEFFSKKKHFFILSAAGKPIYSMHGSDDFITVYAGIIQTIVSSFQLGTSEEKLRSITAAAPGNRRIKFLFLNRSPILMMACSTLGESDLQLVQQLDFLHNFLLATLSKPHIEKMFERRENFDLRHLLGKTDMACLDAICNDLANFNNPGIIVGGLECLKLRKTVRSNIQKLFLKHRSENLLYGLLVAPGGRLVNVMRPRRHTLHTSDLQLLFSMIYDTNTFKSVSNQSGIVEQQNDAGRLTLTQNEDFWVPICLPKFNPNGFVYAFIQFVDLLDERLMSLHGLNPLSPGIDRGETQLTVILISAFKDSFFEMRKASNSIVQEMKMSRPIFRELYKSIVGTQGSDGSTGFPSGRVSPEEIPAPLVKHFIFKSKRYTQFVYSRLQGNDETLQLEDNPQIRAQLMMIYSYLHSKMSGNVGMVTKHDERQVPDLLLSRQNYVDMIRWKVGNDYLTGVLIATPAYEVFLINNGGVVNKKMLLSSCKRIIMWCRRNEERVFIKSGAVF